MATYHLVSHTHWDREWYQTFQQFRLRLVRLVDNLLDILDADPEYAFFMLDGQTIVLEDYLQVRPEREPDIRRYIETARILVGPWYILPDEFLVSPEATIRNLLEGGRVARMYGPAMSVGYLPDTFGHIGQMPQILRGFGINASAVWRGLDDQPCEFWWQAPDGSRVFNVYIRGGYGNAAGLVNKNFDVSVGMANALADSLRPFAATPHLLMMNGTDHQEPSPLTSKVVAFAEGRLGEDVLVHSTLPAYIGAVQSELVERPVNLPVVEGELRSSKTSPLLPGVLSTRMWIKQRNRTCETLLERWAEPFSTLASIVVPEAAAMLRRPAGILRQAWRLLMQCHPHDSICGCSIDAVHDEMRSRFDQVETIGEEIARMALEALGGEINTFPVGATALTALVVFNPSTAVRSDLVLGSIEGIQEGVRFEIVNAEGEVVPHEVISCRRDTIADMQVGAQEFKDALGMISASEGEVGGMKIQSVELRRDGSLVKVSLTGSQRVSMDLAEWDASLGRLQELANDPEIESFHVVFNTVPVTELRLLAPQVPGLGYRTLWVRPKPGQAQDLVPQEDNQAEAIENEFYRVVARTDGALDILDKLSGQWYFGQCRLMDGGDRGDEYNYSPPAQDEIYQAVLESVEVEYGPVERSLVLNQRLDLPQALSDDRQGRSMQKVDVPVITRVSLMAGCRRVEIHVDVDNQACDHRLRAHFTAPFAVSCADYDGHFEVVRRDIDLPIYDSSWAEQPRPEKPQRTFTAVSDGKRGLLVANRGLPEVEVLRREDGTTEVAVTLLRCVGWVSRSDLPERPGHAGPGIETPGAQMPGKWGFDLALLLFNEEERMQAYQDAYDFEVPMRAIGVGLHPGSLPQSASLVGVEPEEFTLSAVKTTEDGRGWLVRGVNLAEKVVTVRIKPLLAFNHAELANLAEERLMILHTEPEGSVSTQVGKHQLRTVVFR